MVLGSCKTSKKVFLIQKSTEPAVGFFHRLISFSPITQQKHTRSHFLMSSACLCTLSPPVPVNGRSKVLVLVSLLLQDQKLEWLVQSGLRYLQSALSENQRAGGLCHMHQSLKKKKSNVNKLNTKRDGSHLKWRILTLVVILKFIYEFVIWNN